MRWRRRTRCGGRRRPSGARCPLQRRLRHARGRLPAARVARRRAPQGVVRPAPPLLPSRRIYYTRQGILNGWRMHTAAGQHARRVGVRGGLRALAAESRERAYLRRSNVRALALCRPGGEGAARVAAAHARRARRATSCSARAPTRPPSKATAAARAPARSRRSSARGGRAAARASVRLAADALADGQRPRRGLGVWSLRAAADARGNALPARRVALWRHVAPRVPASGRRTPRPGAPRGRPLLMLSRRDGARRRLVFRVARARDPRPRAPPPQPPRHVAPGGRDPPRVAHADGGADRAARDGRCQGGGLRRATCGSAWATEGGDRPGGAAAARGGGQGRARDARRPQRRRRPPRAAREAGHRGGGYQRPPRRACPE